MCVLVVGMEFVLSELDFRYADEDDAEDIAVLVEYLYPFVFIYL